MKLTLKLPSLLSSLPLASSLKLEEVEKENAATTENKSISREERKSSEEEERRSLRPRKQVTYNAKQRKSQRKQSTPVKTSAVSVLPLPLGELCERQELGEQLQHLESMDMETLKCTSKKSSAEDGVRYIMHKGRMIREGDYVAVRGHDASVYYAIVYDVCLAAAASQTEEEHQNPERQFRLRWLLPKVEHRERVLGDPGRIEPEHFDFGPMHDGFERVDNIVGVFYSPTDVPYATRWVTKYHKGLRPAPVVSVERREGLRRMKGKEGENRMSRMMQELEAAHMLFDLHKQKNDI